MTKLWCVGVTALLMGCASTQPPPLTQWEHHCDVLAENSLAEEANRWGFAGWELATYDPHEGLACFKRPRLPGVHRVTDVP
jgi:hypothetical protein